MTMILSAVVILAMCWALVKKYETRLVLIAGGLILACMAGDPLAPLVSFSKSMKQANVFEVIIASMGFAAVVKMTGLHTHLIAVFLKLLKVANELTLAKRINEFLAKKDVDGIVVTHGTDTLEETAYFLNLVVKSDKPVVLVGSMRPATGLSADGPLNLVNAVALAASPEAKGKGVMVSMNDKIGSAFGVTKTNTTNVATFQCPDTGCLGIMQNNKPFFFNINTKRHTTNSEFDISKLNALPRVEINYASLGQDGSLIRSMIKMGVKGIVSAGLGHGNVPDDVMEALKEAKKAGIKVVIASRVPTGMITPVGKFTREGFQSAMLHNPQKARILLMMALTETDNDADIQRMFDQY